MLDFRGNSNETKKLTSDFSGRRKVLVIFMMSCMAVLVCRAIDLQVLNKKFLKDQGDMRLVDDEEVSAYRGMITDRSGAPLAISTPVESISVNPRELKMDDKNQLKQLEKEFKASRQLSVPLTDEQKAAVLAEYKKQKVLKIAQMEKLLDLPKGKVLDMLSDDSHKQFAYIARQISPDLSEQVKALKLVGVYFDREFKRFYPTGGVAAHLIGFTDLDDVGQEGMEAGYEKVLKGTAGSKRVIRDGLRRIIDDVENIKEPVSGKNIELSIDQRIQYLAYRELQLAVNENRAKSGALVVLDAKNGEILAAVNQPTFNPNVRKSLQENLYRNRALTDIFEPGSTVKPFVAAAALEGGYVTPNTVFNTNGSFPIGSNVVKDVHNYGSLDLMHVLKKSSNIGVSMMALKMPPKYFWGVYKKLGFGSSAEAGFEGEANGRLLDYKKWHDFDRATMSFGYGLSVSAVQLARAYTALADDGILHSVSLLKRDEDDKPQRVFSAKTAKTIRSMLENVIMKDGTAYEARVDGYTVAGKTGTVKKASGAHGYTSGSYFAVFAGMAPARNPRLIIVVMIDEPSAGQYYGGLVSAPVFSKVMTGALRLLNVAPDQVETMPILLTQKP
ncbi:MAG: penicillin-binding transpeptidase domain-containing protein [Methylococcales bacterium]|nr:penicillin-binding transpeptidase domain-containing protein [Methylococcales bacterium]MDP3840535.1 penicillin-binding transpeptidase domain-containing protein [Methylococcales bacterium]